jgi:signal transduction histidine kinase
MNHVQRILIIDDSPEDCAVYVRHIKRTDFGGCQIDITHSAIEGLKACHAALPDCILLDFSLPDGDGLDILGQLKQEFGDLVPPVIMVTGHGNESVAVQAMKMGAEDYLVKGLTQESLSKAIRGAIENSNLRRQLKLQQVEVARLSIDQARLVQELEARTSELSEADRRKNDFLAVLAHELRNPLGPIRNAANIIRLVERELSPVAEQARTIIDRQVAHMARLIDDLLDVSRIVRGKVLLRKEHLNLTELVRETIDAHRGQANADELQLMLNLPESPVWIEGDPTRLSQIIGNILDNARKYTPHGGQITVTLAEQRDAGFATISIADSGEGLDSGMLGRMFQSFSQADRSLDRSRGGLGLGLAIVKGLAEMHDGTVNAYSAGPGQGCEITVTLPLSSEPVLEQSATGNKAASDRPLRILIIEDNRDAATSLKILLEKIGHVVESAHTGQAGLQLARTFLPELVLCDIGLSDGMNGYEVAKQLRQEPPISSAYLVALTGYGREEDQQRALSAGFDQHLTKPIGLDTLQRLAAGTVRHARVG